MTQIDHTIPGEKWEFDAGVTEVFEDMLERSIPGYCAMRDSVNKLAQQFRQPNTAIVDLGCSRGDALAPLHESAQMFNSFVGVDISGPMLDVARHRFLNHPEVKIKKLDLRTSYPEAEASVTLCVLTLAFVPIEYRWRILADAYRATRPGGVLIVVEKILGSGPRLNSVFVDTYLGMKAEHGYTGEEIERKRLSLEGVLVPLSAAQNMDMLRGVGFAEVDTFWRHLNFAGFIAVKS